MNLALNGKCLALVSQAKRFSHGAVKVFDKGQRFGTEIGNGDEIAPFEQLVRENAEPNLDDADQMDIPDSEAGVREHRGRKADAVPKFL